MLAAPPLEHIWLPLAFETAQYQEPQGIVEQASKLGCRAGFYWFRMEKNEREFFNGSIVQWRGQEWIVTRVHDGPWAARGRNYLMMFRLKDNTPHEGRELKVDGTHPRSEFEDPRAFVWNGKLTVGCVTYFYPDERQDWWGATAHQILFWMDDNFKSGRLNHPCYGNNGREPGYNTAPEKNWTWFEWERRLFCIYHISQGHEIFEFTDGKPTRTFDSDCSALEPWTAEWGEPRGGSYPVRVGDEYFAFFHSCRDMENHSGWRRYVMGAYAFEAKPPFRITRMTKRPILIGSNNDKKHNDGTSPAVFPSGAILRGENNEWWKITGGCNDTQVFWMDMRHDKLLSMMEEVA